MLQKLTIKNIALIDYAEIEFSLGLNVLSGETGAGKSVIIESLNFVLGAKADKTLIRSGENECLVKAEFDVSNLEGIFPLFDECDIEKDDLLIISRKFNLDGKSVVKINGETVTIAMLKKFTALLIDVHGQSEHFSLLKNSNQLALLDKFGLDDIKIVKDDLKNLYSNYKSIIKELDSLGGDEGQRLNRIDILNYYINEIESAEIVEGEEEKLKEIKEKLNNREKIITALSLAKSALEDEGGVSEILSNAVRSVGSVSNLSEVYGDIYQRISSLLLETDDVKDSISNCIDSLEDEEYDINSVEERLDLIKKIKKKYGDSVSEIEKFLVNAKEELEKLENFSALNEKLLKEKDKFEGNLYKEYLRLSKIRREKAKEFANNVTNELVELGMPKAIFDIDFSINPEFSQCKFDSANGFDKIEFLFSANLGEPLKPLSNVISGGEMSRFMLSVKAQTAKFNDISTFIFDEIDAGISGIVAKSVAEKFAKISTSSQIIAISHLPQISAMADNNLLIQKFEGDEKTITSVKRLNSNDKVNEIIRLVGGDYNSESAKTHAKELIANALQFKKNLKKRDN